MDNFSAKMEDEKLEEYLTGVANDEMYNTQYIKREELTGGQSVTPVAESIKVEIIDGIIFDTKDGLLDSGQANYDPISNIKPEKPCTSVSELNNHEEIQNTETPRYNLNNLNKNINKKEHKKINLRQKPLKKGNKHNLKITKEGKVECEICGKHLAHKFVYENHMRTHTGEKPFKCEQCGNCYSQKVHLKTHMMSHTGLKPHKCELCEYAFVSNSKLRQHKNNVHNQDGAFKCDVCSARFKTSGLRRKHAATHVNNSLLMKCESCGIEVTGLENYQNHLKEHVDGKSPDPADNKQYMCNTNKKQFECLSCGTSFTRRSHLKTHSLRVHTIEKPYKCEICDKTFAIQLDMKEHQKYHPGYRTFMCEHCGKCFSHNTALQSHMSTHSTDKVYYKCNLCPKSYQSKSSLGHHSAIHSINSIDSVSSNDDQLKSYEGLNLAIDATGKSDKVYYNCQICSKSYQSKSALGLHSAVHTDNQIQRCTVCDKRFVHKHNLKTHFKRMHGQSELKNNDKGGVQTQIDKSWQYGNDPGMNSAPLLNGNLNLDSNTNHINSEASKGKVRYIRINNGKRFSLKTEVECEVCGKILASKSKYEIHKRSHTGEKPFKCEQCGMFFTQKSQRTMHMFTHSGVKPHKCELCGYASASKSKLKWHKSNVHIPDGLYNCDVCSARFKTCTLLSKHASVHTNHKYDQDKSHCEKLKIILKQLTDVKPFICQLCGTSYSTNPELVTHAESQHADNKEYICGVCGCTMDSTDQLAAHIETHGSDKPYKCSVCAISFASKSSLETHTLRVHTSEKLFKCEICPKRFALPTDLKEHLKLHPGNRKHMCEQCGKFFSHNSNLQAHMYSHSTEKVYHKCQICSKSYQSKSALGLHLDVHSGKQVHKCTLCDKALVHRHNLKRHMNTVHGHTELSLKINNELGQKVLLKP